jgi:hypothetical protein
VQPSSMLGIAALVSVLVWLGFLGLLLVAWVEDRQRETDEMLRQSKLGGWSQRAQRAATELPDRKVEDHLVG